MPTFRFQMAVFLLLPGLLAGVATAQQTSAPATDKQEASAPKTGSSQQPANTAPATSPTGTAAEQPKSIPPDKVVLKVGDENVTAGELDRLLKMAPADPDAQKRDSGVRKKLGDQYVLMLVLAGKAASDHLDSTPELAKQLAMQRTQLLARAEYQNLYKQSVPTSEEVNQYYAVHKDEFEQAVIHRAYVRMKAADSKQGTPGLSPEEAKARAEAIAKAFSARNEISQVAKEFNNSTDVNVDSNAQPVLMSQLPPEFREALVKLKPGEVSAPIESPPGGFYVIRLVSRKYLELKEVSSQIESKLRDARLNREIDSLKSKAGVWMDEEYFNSAPPPPPAGVKPKTRY